MAAATATVPPPASIPHAAMRRAGSTIGSVLASSVTRYGTSRPFVATMTAIVPSSSHTGPGASSAASRSFHASSPIGRSRSRVRLRGVPAGRSITHSSGCISSGGSSRSVPTKARRRPSGAKAGRPASPRRLTSSRTRGRAPSVAIHQIWERGLMFASGPRSASKAMRRPSGDHAGFKASKSPCVSCRGAAPGRNGMTHRCARRSMCPDSSSRKSRRVIRRASGVLPFRSVPTMKRGSPAVATSAKRSPRGLQWTLDTPCFRSVSLHGSPPSSGSTHAWETGPSEPTDARTNARWRPSGEMAGMPSRTRPRVSWRGRPPRAARSHRCDS